METYPVSDRSRVRRRAQRGQYDKATIHAILDEALIAHVGFVAAGQPVVLPMAFVRIEDSVYLHGSTRARMLVELAAGADVCVAATLLDDLVLARSAFHHSMNYRSAVVYGRGRAVADRDAALRAVEALTDKLAPGRWSHVRAPNDAEMKATLVVEIPIDEASAKVRRGAPVDDEEDLALDVWAGCVPVHTSFGAAVVAPDLKSGVPQPEHVRRMTRIT